MTRRTKTSFAHRLVIVMSLALLGLPAAFASIPAVVMSDHQTMYTTSTDGAYGMAANARGDVFFADYYNDSLDMIPAGSTLPATPTILLTGMNGPQQVAVDKSGNVYVADMYNGKVYRVSFVNGTYATNTAVSSFNASSGSSSVICTATTTADCRLTPISLYSSIRIGGIAVDSAGNVFLADIYDATSTGSAVRILKQTPAGVTTAILTNLPALTSGYTNAQLAVDASENLYYTDQNNLYLITTGTTPTATIENSTKLTNPSGVTIDLNTGNLIVSDYGNTPSRIVVIPNESGTLNFNDQYMLAPYQTRSSVGVDGKGTIYYSSANGSASTLSQMQISVYGVPSLAVNASSTSALVYSTFNAASTVLNSYAISGHGASIVYSSNTCVFPTTFTPGQYCSYNISIKPTRVGPVSGTIMNEDASGNVLSQFTLTANATGSAVAIDPGTAATIGSGYTTPAGVAVDKAGNVFVADRTANTVYELVGGTGTPVSLGSGLSGPTGVAVDATGNLYIADTGNTRVVEIPVVGTALTTANQIVVASSLTAPIAIATGPLNSLYIAQSGSLASYENRGYVAPTQTAVISTAYTAPRALAVDPSGDIFIADSALGKVVELANYTYATTTIATGLTLPTGLVTDAAGDLFLIDNGAAQAIRIPNISGTLTTAQEVSLGSFTAPYGVGIDESGNLYISDASVPTVYEITRTTGLVNFGTVDVNVTSPAYTASLLSSGNQSLTLGTPVDAYSSGDTTHFSLTSATNCTSGEVLAAGSSCNIAATFTPTTSATVSEVYALSASPTVAVSPFTLTLTGTGGALITTTTTITPAPSTTSYGSTVSIAVAVTANSGSGTPTGTVTLTATPAGGTTATLLNAVTLTNGAYTYTGVLPTGTDTLVATYSGSTVYNGSSSSTTVTVSPIVPQVSWTPSATTQTYGTAISSGVLDASVASPAGSIAYTSNISTGSCGTTITTSCVLNTGTYTLTATFTPTDNVDYATATATISYTVTAAAPLSAYVPRIVMSNHQTLYSSLSNGTYGVAANARGDIFFSDVANNSLDMLAAGSTTPVQLLTGMNDPQQVTVDTSGNVYVADMYNGKVYRVPLVSGAYPSSTAVSNFNASSGSSSVLCSPSTTADCRLSPITLYTLIRIAGEAVDGAGNVYLAEIYDGTSLGAYTRILKQTSAGVTTALLSTLPAATNAQLASDSSGNLYYTDGTNLYSIPSGSSTATIENSSLLKNPSGVTIDPAGNLIVSDYGNSRIVVIPIESGVLNFADQYVLAPNAPEGSVGVDGKGTIYYSGNTSGASSVSAMQTSIYGVPALAVGASSSTALVYATFNYPTTFAQYLTLSRGASMGYVANTCVIGNTYGIGQSCSFNTSITPARVGPVSGVIGIADASGNYYSQFTLTANATGSAVAIDPGTVATIGTGFKKPAGVAVDKAGNIFIADSTANAVYELVGGTGTPVSLGSGLSGPTGVAVDATGNLYIADTGNTRVIEIPVVGSVLTTANQIVVASSLTAPIAIATGPLNSLYIAQSGSLASYANRGYGSPVKTAVISTSYTAPRALAVDPSGDIFVADSVLGDVVELANYTYAPTVVTTGLTLPTGLATDAAGDLFLIDNGAAQAARIPNISGTLTTAQEVSLGSFTAPYGVGIDGSGNLYISDTSVPAVYEITRTTGLLNFGTINVNTTSPAHTASLLSSGNQSLTLGTPVDAYSSGDTTHFSITSATSCTSGEVLAAGSSCNLAATFAPTTTASLSEVFALSASPTVAVSPFTLTLSGIGGVLIPTTTTVTPSLTTTSYGTTVTVSVTVSANSGGGTPTGTLTLTATPSGGTTTTLLNAVTLTNGAYTYTGVLPTGSDTLVATYSGSTVYNASSSSITVSVLPIVPQISWTPSATTQTYGTAISSGVLDATVASPAGSIAYTSNTSVGSCGTVITTSCYLSVGAYTLTATFTPTDTVDYTTATATISYTVTAAAPLSAYVPRIVMSNHQTLYSSLSNGTYGVAANARGDIFFSDVANNSLDMLPAGSTTPVQLLTGMDGPRSVMVDSSGNVYVSDMYNIKVYRVPFVNGSYPTGVAISSFTSTTVVYCSAGLTTDCRLPPFGTVTGNAAETTSIAIDGAGNYYGADVHDGVSGGAYSRIFKQTPAGVDTIVVDALPATTNAQIVSDTAGNLYYTDAANLYYIPAGSSTATVENAATLKNPSGVTLDPAGNLIVSDYGNSRIVVIPNENGTLNFSDQYMLAPYSPRCSVGVDAKGTIYYPGNTSGASSISAMQSSVYGVPSLAVGASSTTALVYAAFNYPTTFSQYLTLGYGASMGYVSNSCVIGGIYGIGQSCGFNTYIKPSRVGPVSGVIGIADASGNYYSQFTLTANATGSAVAIDPGTAAGIGSGFTAPSGVAVDKSGNVFIADTSANTVYELVGGAGTPVALGTGLSGPTGVTVDATGNLFIADTGNSRVVEIPVAGSVLTTANQAVVAKGLTAPIAIAIGPLNSLYIAQSGQLAVYANRGYSLPGLSSVISTAFLLPRSLTVDSSGNVFVGDANTGTVVEIAAYTNTQTTIATGLTAPTGLATDAAGDLFVIDNGTAQALRIPNISGTLTYAQAVSLGSFNSPYGLGIDELGNLYLSDPSVPAAYKIVRSTGAVNLGYTNQGVTSSPGSASLLSSGNQSLTLGTPLYTASGDTTHFAVTSATTCTAGATLAAGSSCSLTETFTPSVIGTSSEVLALNAAPTVTTTPLNVTFSGYGTYQVATTLAVASTQSGSLGYGQAATFKATLTPSQFNVAAATGTVTFTINGVVQRPIILSSNTASITTSALSGGSNTISATYSGDLNYEVSSAAAITVNVTPGTTVTTLSISAPYINPVSAAPGSTVTLTALVVPSVSGVVSGVVNFVSGTTVLGSATLTATSTGAYQASLATPSIPLGSYNVSAVYLGSLDYSGSNSTTLPLLISNPSIYLSASTTNFTSTPSTPGSVTISVSSVSGLGNGSSVPVVFSCSGLPANTICQVVPEGISLAASPSTAPVAPTPVVLTVMVDVAPGTPFPPVSQISPRGRTTLLFACLLSLPILFRRRSKLRSILLLAFALCLLPVASMLCGCGNSAKFLTPTGTTPITVTATSTSATTSITLNLTVAN